MTTARIWAPMPTLAISLAMLHGVLSLRGLLLWPGLGSVLAIGLVGGLLAAGRRLAAMSVALGLPVLLALLANAVGGQHEGPLARATWLCSGLSAVAAVVIGSVPTRSGVALLSLLPAFALLASVLALGAAGQGLVWTGAWVVGMGASLVMLGPLGAVDLAPSRRRWPLAVLLTLAGAIAVLVAVLASTMLGDPWTIPGLSAGSPAVSQVPQAPTTKSPPDATWSYAGIPWWLVVVLVLVILMLGLLLALLAWQVGRRVWALIAWSRLARTLGSGAPAERVMGAWTWSRLRRERVGDPFPAWASPDVVALAARHEGDANVARLAHLASVAAFVPGVVVTTGDADEAWRGARRADARWRSGTLRERWRWSARRPTIRSRVST